MEIKKCFICEIPLSDHISSPCDKCDLQLKFCHPDHLFLHSPPGHACLPFHITTDPRYGRFLVAARDMTQGELVVRETAVAWGPNHIVGRTLCMECLCNLEDDTACHQCGYPLCAKHITTHPKHEAECQVFTEMGVKLAERKDMGQNSLCIGPLRCLVLKEKRPQDWRLLLMLMDHEEERRKKPETYLHHYENVIRKLSEEVGCWSEAEIVRVLGVLDVNSMMVRLEGGLYRGRGLFPVASLINHSCISNARNIITGDNLETRAAVAIPAGEPITCSYVSPLLPVYLRRKRLAESYFFSCLCERCQSPNDLGAYTSAVFCCKCSDGYLLPVTPTDWQTRYRCHVCNHEEEGKEVVNMATEKEVMQHLNRLHPKHHVQLEIKLDLIHKLGRPPLDSLEDLDRKSSLCLELLEVMDVVYPGRSKFRGFLLYELGETCMMRASRGFQQKSVDKGIFLDSMAKSTDCFEEGIKCLMFDKEGSVEYDICQKLRTLNLTTRDFITFAEFM